MEEKEYKDFFSKYEEFKNIQTEQKNDGKNDFNILTSVLKYSDEVRLHSRMIGKLLDIDGKHYRGELFLKLFLETIDLHEWGLKLSETTVSIGYIDIDLYITDGEKHIIIENKIWAKDQPCQVTKYINIIVEENKESIDVSEEDDGYIKLKEEQLIVIYLTPRGREKPVPEDHSKDKDGYIYFSGKDEKLQRCSKKSRTDGLVKDGFKNYKAKYKKITYKDEIFKWLVKSQKAVENITNLHEALRQYIDAVKMVNKTYKGRVLQLKDYWIEHKYPIRPLFIIKEKIEDKTIIKEISGLQSDLLYELFSQDIDGLEHVNTEVKEISKKQKKLVYAKRKCKAFFGIAKGRKRDFGSFYYINKNDLLLIFVGVSHIHFGIVGHANYKLDMHDVVHQPKDAYGLELINRKTGFGGLRWHSKGYPNMEVLGDYDNSAFKKGLDDLIAIIDYNNKKNE